VVEALGRDGPQDRRAPAVQAAAIGDLDEQDESIVRQVDVDAVHEPEDHMTVEEANVSAGIGVARAPDHGGPVDTIDDGEFTEAEPVLDEGEQAELGFQAPASAGVDDDPLVQAAREAGMFEIPNGQHRGLTLAELNAKGGKAESWFKWAVANIENPPAYKAAILAFCRVHHPEWCRREREDAEVPGRVARRRGRIRRRPAGRPARRPPRRQQPAFDTYKVEAATRMDRNPDGDVTLAVGNTIAYAPRKVVLL
jgi:hypothetical protein